MVPTLVQHALEPAIPSAEATAELTRTCQSFTSAGLVAALESAWSAIRDQHPEVPSAVLVLGSGSSSKPGDGLKLGHFASLRWQQGEQRVAEVLVSGEGLARPAAEVFTTLLHEAAHGLADSRGVKDTSRQGRWHNQRFAQLADELGLNPSKDDKLGWSLCTLRPSTRDTYRSALNAIDAAMGAYRHPDELAQKTRTNNNNGQSLTCACPRRIRVATTTLEEGPILCGLCHSPFLTDDQRDDNDETETVPVYDFGQAPRELATRAQLCAANLRPGQQPIAARLRWRHGTRFAHLYRIDRAEPKRQLTPAQIAATERAKQRRRTCPSCGQHRPYLIPRRLGECLDCAAAGAP